MLSLEVKLILSYFYLGDSEWRSLIFHLKLTTLSLEVKLTPSYFYLGDNEWRKVMIRFHTLIVVKVQSCTFPKEVLHQSTYNFLVEGVGGLRHREWSARVVLFPQFLEIILADFSQCNQIHTAWMLLLLTLSI